MHSIGSFCYSQLILFTHIRFCLYLRCESFYLCLRVFWLFSSEYLQFSRFFLKEFRLFVFYGNLFGCLLRRRRRCSASDTSSTNSRVYVRQLCSEYQEIWLCGGANRIWHNTLTFLQTALMIYCWSKEFRSNIFWELSKFERLWSRLHPENCKSCTIGKYISTITEKCFYPLTILIVLMIVTVIVVKIKMMSVPRSRQWDTPSNSDNGQTIWFLLYTW